MGLFSKRLIYTDVLEWQIEQYEILIRNLGSGPGLPDSRLWLPVDAHFGHPEGKKPTGRDLAEFVFDKIKAQCGFGPDTDFELNIIETPKGGFMGGTAIIKMDGLSACGTYQITQNDDGTYTETITIDERLISQPVNLIATLSHELAHALHNRMREPLDIEPEHYELFTDLTAVYLGYGIFLANSRFEFVKFQDGELSGWQASGAGYLPEADLVMGLAIFMKIKDIAADAAIEHLKPRLGKMLRKAFRQLEKHNDEIERLRALEPLEEPV